MFLREKIHRKRRATSEQSKICKNFKQMKKKLRNNARNQPKKSQRVIKKRIYCKNCWKREEQIIAIQNRLINSNNIQSKKTQCKSMTLRDHKK